MIKFIKWIIKVIQGYFNYLKFRITETKKIKQAHIVFILPYYHTGGAEKVHLNIVKALSHQKCCVIFTHLSATTNFYDAFKKHAEIVEINSIRNKKSYFLQKRLDKNIIKTINNSNTIHTVFGSNTNYFYSVVAKFDNHLKKIDLIHAISPNDERALTFAKTAKTISYRVCINQKAKNDLILIYKQNNINKTYTERIKIIENGINIIEADTEKNQSKTNITFGFVGRWSEEKRPEIFLAVAKQIKIKYPKVHFVMAGTGMKPNIRLINNSGVEYLGEITNFTQMNKLYKSLTGVVITSISEGFPMVFMESMIFGVIPISTNVGGISQHVSHLENGMLINSKSKAVLIEEFVEKIEDLICDNLLMSKLAFNSKKYATKHFNIEKFNKSYQDLFL
ncbi:glycosyltransferase family 4 protein [Algibacter pacificus]|uniref:glycosyltransferase family 4 protein n=1 Tax=Algibacter pacificus TaxID=2599389 RepID=UPI0011CA3FCE|nr:glycosyltransferase family 4 protein [Algibacter pacificus]